MRKAVITMVAAVVALGAGEHARAMTSVSGSVSGQWSLTGSPYIVDGDVLVPNGQALVIDPGVQVEFNGHYRFEVSGTLSAVGTLAAPIVFTRAQPTAGSRGWGIRFVNASAAQSVLSRCVIEYGYADNGNWDSSLDDRGGGIFIQGSDVLIEYSTIRYNEASTGAGIHINGQTSVVTVRNNLIHENNAVNSGFNACGGGGINAANTGDQVLIYNNLIWGNTYTGNVANYEGGGGIHLDFVSAKVVNNTIWGNDAPKGAGIHVQPEGSSAPLLANNIVWGNTGSVNGEQISLQVSYDPGFPLSVNLSVENNVIDTGGIVQTYRNNFESVYVGVNTISVDPLLVDPANGDFGLDAGSSAIDAANSGVMGYPATDYADSPRVDAATPDTGSGPVTYADIGALEYSGTCADADGDGFCDPFDNCPAISNPGQADGDGDGTGDDCDNCPADPNKIDPGSCGCGNPDGDSDGDGLADCVDGCPQDPLKTDPGICGCGNADDDSDGDGTPDCSDGCPQDPLKADPGDCGCGNADNDTDADGTADCLDGCPGDPDKLDPGVCGCDVSDTDSDGDFSADCLDLCPNDPLNDADRDGFCAPQDNCPDMANPGQEDTDGDGIGDACGGDPPGANNAGCGCRTDGTGGGGVAWGLWLLLAGALLRRRRNSARISFLSTEEGKD